MSLGGVEAVVFDLLYTVHPGDFPGGGGRTTWLADLLGIDERVLKTSWDSFEPLLESGRAPATRDLGPELLWLTQIAAGAGKPMGPEVQAVVEREWDVTRWRALLDPPVDTVATLVALRSEGVKIGVLSNTHALEVRSWPLSGLVDGVAFSHEIGVVKPGREAYDAVLERVGVPAGDAAYVGDGSYDESGTREWRERPDMAADMR
ncbi:MAG: HAD family hydrolase [Actinobacteria bacterium]|nr:HAD family hydrolase [Actinomycetota bacterium]